MRQLLPAGLAGLALALAACGGGAGDAASGDGARRAAPRPTGSTAPAGPVTTVPAPVTTPAPPAAAVPAAFRFTAPALGGGRVQGSDYAGTGVALWFWAPW